MTHLSKSPTARRRALRLALGHGVSASDKTTAQSANGWSLAMLSLPAAMLVGWLAIVVTGDGRLDALGNPVGGDYAMFHMAGEMAAAGQWSQLYDEPAQQRKLLDLFPQLPSDTYLPYRYPPLVAILASPLACLPYPAAFMLFTFLSVSAWLTSWWLLAVTFFQSTSQRAQVDRWLAFLVMAPIAVQTLMDGQASLIWFALAATSWCALHRGQQVLAGCLLALAACKPNVMLLLGVMWIVRYPRMLLGVVPMGLIMFCVTILVAGGDCLSSYIKLARELASSPWQVETPYWKVQSLLSWSELCLGDCARRVHLIIGLAAAVLIGLWWRSASMASGLAPETSGRIDALALSCGLSTNALLNPYTPIYDLTLLQLGLFAWFVVATRQNQLSVFSSDNRVRIALIALWIGPIVSQAISKAIASPLQLMPLALLAILIGLVAAHIRGSGSSLGRLQHCL